jgi:hypothetical protein
VIATRPSTAGACAGGLSEGTGAVAVASVAPDGTSSFTFTALAPDGAARESFTALRISSQPSGWHGLAAAGSSVEHLVIDPEGAVTPRTLLAAFAGAAARRTSFGEDPAGGSLVTLTEGSQGSDLHTTTARRFDPEGALSGAPITIEGGTAAEIPDLLAGGVSTRGDSLHVWNRGERIHRVWHDPEGRRPEIEYGEEALRDVVPSVAAEALRAADAALVPLLDGSLVLRVNTAWVRRWPHLSPASEPAPPWLSEREGARLRFTRANRGYALFPPAGRTSADCSQAIELVAPSGRLCGRVVLHGDGTPCTTGAVDQGWDGTVVQQTAQGSCTYRWWPRLLGGG